MFSIFALLFNTFCGFLMNYFVGCDRVIGKAGFGFERLGAMLMGIDPDDPEIWGGKRARNYKGYMASAAVNPAVVPPISTMGRTELIGTITLNTINTPFNLPTNGGLIPNDRFLAGLILRLSGRITNAGAGNPTGTQADGLPALLDTITIEGQHLLRGTREQFILARGPDIREFMGLYLSRMPRVVGTLATGVGAAVDFTVFCPIWFFPLGIPAAQQAYYLLDAPNYSNLKLTVQWPDDKNIYTGQTTAGTFSANGSGTGSPIIDVYGVFAQAGPSAFKGYVPGRMFLTFQENLSSLLTTTATQQQLFNLPTGFHLRSVMLKTGVKSTATTSGNNSYNTLSDTILSNLKWQRGFNKNHRIYKTYDALKEDSAMAYALLADTGYALMDYCQHGTVKEAMDASQLVSGATGDVAFNIVSDVAGAANQGAVLVQEELRYDPQLLSAA